MSPPANTRGEVLLAVEQLLLAMSRHCQAGGGHPLNPVNHPDDPAAAAVRDMIIMLMREARHLHPAGGDYRSDFLLAWNVVMEELQGVSADPLRDTIAAADNPAHLVGDDTLFHLYDQALANALLDSHSIRWRDGVLDLAVGLLTWPDQKDHVGIGSVDLGRWSPIPFRRIPPSLQVLTTERAAARIAGRLADTATRMKWTWSASFMPRRQWREGGDGVVPVWRLAPVLPRSWFFSRAAAVEQDLQDLARAFGRFD